MLLHLHMHVLSLTARLYVNEAGTSYVHLDLVAHYLVAHQFMSARDGRPNAASSRIKMQDVITAQRSAHKVQSERLS